MLQEYENKIKENTQLVTIFLLTHNREYYLKDAVDSILQQSYSNFSLVVLDNMSTDNTESLIKDYQKIDKRIIYVKRKSNKSYDNTLYAFSICHTKYIIVFHDDDIVKKEYLETVLNFMEENEQYCAISPAAETIDASSNITGTYRSNKGNICYSEGSYFNSHFKKDGPSMIYPAVMYRTEFYKESRLFFILEAGPASDQYVWFQTERLNGKLFFLDKILFQYRNHSTQDSAINRYFMDLALIDFLLSTDYYKNKIYAIKEYMVQYIWDLFVGISLNYYKGLITPDKYKAFFDYKCVQLVSKSINARGCLYSVMEKLVWRLKRPLKFTYQVVKNKK